MEGLVGGAEDEVKVGIFSLVLGGVVEGKRFVVKMKSCVKKKLFAEVKSVVMFKFVTGVKGWV